MLYNPQVVAYAESEIWSKLCAILKNIFLMFDHIHCFDLKFHTINANEVVEYLLLAAGKATDIWSSFLNFLLF